MYVFLSSNTSRQKLMTPKPSTSKARGDCPLWRSQTGESHREKSHPCRRWSGATFWESCDDSSWRERGRKWMKMVEISRVALRTCYNFLPKSGDQNWSLPPRGRKSQPFPSPETWVVVDFSIPMRWKKWNSTLDPAVCVIGLYYLIMLGPFYPPW